MPGRLLASGKSLRSVAYAVTKLLDTKWEPDYGYAELTPLGKQSECPLVKVPGMSFRRTPEAAKRANPSARGRAGALFGLIWQ